MAKKSISQRRPQTNELVALAFNPEGKLLASARPDGDAVQFDLDREELQFARVFVFPEPPAGTEGISLEHARRLEAYEPSLRFGPNNQIDLSRIPDSLRARWLWYRCCARGRVTKRFLIDGAYQERPICNAVVHICEVDPVRLSIPIIPPEILERLRDSLLGRIPIPIPDPLPDPPPFRVENIVPPRPFAANAAAPVSFRAQSAGNLNLNLQSHIGLPDNIQLQLLSADAEQMRAVLLQHIEILRPYICIYPFFWPYFYRCDEIARVRTDFNGRFDACFWQQITGDKADLYFWVEYEIDGVLQTVYRPSIPCHTYWNYPCGEEVSIRITDPRVPFGCFRPLGGELAWVKSIGWGAHVSRIEQGLFASIPQQGQTLRTVGLTDYATGGLGYGLAGQKVRPFAAGLNFVVQFGTGFPSGNVTHYRWSYRKTHNDKLFPASASEQDWKAIDTPIMHKGYNIEVTDPVTLVTTVLPRQYKLGPFELPNGQWAYKIPRADATHSDISGGDPTARWQHGYDTITLSLNSDTQLLGDGLYEFKLEFFNNGGIRQNVADTVNQISNPANLGQSQPATPDFLIPTVLDSFRPFRMKVRIDNQRCTAQIYDVLVDGNPSSTECGFVEYASRRGSDVRFRFEASHPNNFATFNFNVKRGNSSDPLSDADTSGMVIGSTSNYVLNTLFDYYQHDVNVGYLLGSCPDKAAFAEALHVDGLHTNGNAILNTFDASALAAFALEPNS